jgi:4-amino-4-deoxy-L-arabinose transferase-like glycosyltransferase
MLNKLIPFALIALIATVLILQVLLRPALPVDETRALSVAWEMHISGNPFLLTENFAPYSHKPPLLYWLINLVWWVTGPSELAARLVGPAMALIGLALTARLARRIWPQDATLGTRTMMVLAGFTFFILFAGTTMFDALLTIPVLLGALAIWRIGQGQGDRGVFLLLGLAFGGGVLAKGPVIFVHLLPLLLSVPLWAPAPPDPGKLLRGLALALGVALALVAVWLVPALIMMEAATRLELLWSQSAHRVAGSLGHGRPVWFLLALLPVLLFPWGWSWRLWRALPGTAFADAGGRFCAIWAVSGLVLFSVIGGKQLHYLMPELPAVALLMARAMSPALRPSRGGSLAFLPPVLIGAAALAFAIGLVPVTGALADLRPLWPVLLFAAVCFGLAGATWRLPLLPGHLTLGLGLALALHLLVAMTALAPGFSARPIANRLAGYAPQGIAVVGMPYEAEFNFAARLTAPVATPAPDALSGWMAAHPGGVVAGPVASAAMPAAPSETFRFRGQDFGLWPVQQVVPALLPPEQSLPNRESVGATP